MDPRGAPLGPLARLAAAAGTGFPHLDAARERTERALRDRRAALAPGHPDPPVAVVLMGSWGRGELTSGSDDDFVVLGEGEPGPDAARAVLDHPPGPEGIFGRRVQTAELVERIGLDGDTNANFTLRMLLLLESVALLGTGHHLAARRAILERYLGGVRDHQVPRFLLNDLIRYWRTICVDFEGKAVARAGQGWGLRNAKLRTSRKLLFASGLLPVLGCHALERGAMLDGLWGAFSTPPVDRVATAFLRYDAVDAGARALAGYDAFVGMLDDPEQREHLRSLTRETAQDDALFQRARRHGGRLEAGLLALLFERRPLSELVREYGVF